MDALRTIDPEARGPEDPAQALQREIENLDLQIQQIDRQLEAEASVDQRLSFFELKEKLFKRKEKSMREQIRLANLRAGQIYGIEEIATDKPKYVGLTEQGGTDSEEPFEVRFGQHGRVHRPREVGLPSQTAS